MLYILECSMIGYGGWEWWLKAMMMNV